MQMHEIMRARREQLRLSQADVAAAAGISERQIRSTSPATSNPASRSLPGSLERSESAWTRSRAMTRRSSP